MSRTSAIFWLGAVTWLGGCEVEPCPGGSMIDSPGGLVVTESEHPEAWGADECFACHGAATLHRYACVDDVDLEALRALVDDQGDASCASCHGDNGVAE
jgi:hypothetical protein